MDRKLNLLSNNLLRMMTKKRSPKRKRRARRKKKRDQTRIKRPRKENQSLLRRPERDQERERREEKAKNQPKEPEEDLVQLEMDGMPTVLLRSTAFSLLHSLELILLSMDSNLSLRVTMKRLKRRLLPQVLLSRLKNQRVQLLHLTRTSLMLRRKLLRKLKMLLLLLSNKRLLRNRSKRRLRPKRPPILRSKASCQNQRK